ncbi:MAG: nickel-responsive transcriptional regulator NikR [Candidatus Bathyarchaeota archaeon]|nr:nickel-responsive transcriptional regulator NikR [Candidatus Bathyarchaeota archaeon]
MSIISVSIPENLLEKVDSHMQEQGFANRSEIIRQALRAYLSESRKLSELQGKLAATITIIYKSESRTEQIIGIQHAYSSVIATFLHIHVEQDYCIEIIVAKGEAKTIKALITALKANKQISEVKVTTL